VPHGILQVFIIILYENVFQNPKKNPTHVSLSHKQSTLDYGCFFIYMYVYVLKKIDFQWIKKSSSNNKFGLNKLLIYPFKKLAMESISVGHYHHARADVFEKANFPAWRLSSLLLKVHDAKQEQFDFLSSSGFNY
jgi:hypothetical protein